MYISKSWTNIIKKVVHKWTLLCNIFTMLVPTISLLGHDNPINCFPEQTVWITVWALHLTKYVVMVGLEPCLDCCKSILNGVQVEGVGGEIQQSHSAVSKNQCYLGRINQYVPFFNHLMDTWSFMDACIVHDKHWVWHRPGLHSVQYTTNKILEFFSQKGVI